MMHTYRKVADKQWVVGYWVNDSWKNMLAFDNIADAVAMVSYLNGGAKPDLQSVLSDLEKIAAMAGSRQR